MNSPRVGGYSNNRHRWTLGEATLGVCSKLFPPLAENTLLPADKFDGFLVPEKLENRTPEQICMLKSQLSGASVAVFHDLIPVKFPEYATRRSLAEFPRYLQSLLYYDGVAAVSESSRQDLLDYWKKNGVLNPPPVEAISPGTELFPMGLKVEKDNKAARPEVLMVGTVEARKNHLGVLGACEQLWGQGLNFELILAGRMSNDSGRVVRGRIRELQRKNRPLRWVGHAGDGELKRLYEACRFTLHPSLYEGYGLPVLESLRYGKPCVITDRGALSQIAKDGGGCYVINDPIPSMLAGAIRDLLLNSKLYERLVNECRERKFKRWDEYCDELTLWQRALKKRANDRSILV